MGLVMATAAKTVYAHITKDPKVCGGKACLDNTRIRVMDIVELQREGKRPEEMLHCLRRPAHARAGPRGPRLLLRPP